MLFPSAVITAVAAFAVVWYKLWRLCYHTVFLMDLNESNDSSLRTEHLQQKSHCGHRSLLSVPSSQIFTELFSSLDLIFNFARLIVERMASSARPTFASSLIDV